MKANYYQERRLCQLDSHEEMKSHIDYIKPSNLYIIKGMEAWEMACFFTCMLAYLVLWFVAALVRTPRRSVGYHVEVLE